MGRPARSSLDGELAANARRLFISGDVVRGFLDGATAAEVRAANRLLSAELESRDVHRRERLMRRARFPQVKSFEGYDYSQVAFPDGYGPADLESLSFLDTAEGFVFHGRTGRGKTHLATAMGVRAVSMGRPVRFHSTARLGMNSRDPFPDEELRRRIMDFIMAAGQTLLENGAEVFRVEQTMEIMARSFHLREFHVYVLTNGIFASAGTAEISEVRNVPVRTTHLGRVAAVNELSRQIAQTGMTLDEAESRLVLARRLPFPKDHVQLLSGLCGAFCFAMMFGGNLRSALAAAGAGLVASWYLLWCGRHEVPGGFQKISTAALITLVCILLCSVLHTSASHAIIGALMILTPGIAFTMGIRDFVQGDYLSGTIRMIDALLIAASIAIGTGLVLRLYTIFTGVVVV